MNDGWSEEREMHTMYTHDTHTHTLLEIYKHNLLATAHVCSAAGLLMHVHDIIVTVTATPTTG